MRTLLLLSATCFALSCSALEEVTGVPTTFSECVAAGFPVTKSYPQKCITADKKVFVEKKSADNHPPALSSNCRDLCGDDECQEIVCMEVNCPCSESSSSCPQDCP